MLTYISHSIETKMNLNNVFQTIFGFSILVILRSVAKTQKGSHAVHAAKIFINQQGLSVHDEKCVHGVVAKGKILSKSSHSTPKTESESEIQRAVSSTMDKILSLVAEESSNSEKGNACTSNCIYFQCNISFGFKH